MELETNISCPGIVNKSRLSLVDLNNIPTDLADKSITFSVRIIKIGRCKELKRENRCNLTNEECIFRDLLVFERRDFEDEDFDDEEFYGRTDY